MIIYDYFSYIISLLSIVYTQNYYSWLNYCKFQYHYVPYVHSVLNVERRYSSSKSIQKPCKCVLKKMLQTNSSYYQLLNCLDFLSTSFTFSHYQSQGPDFFCQETVGCSIRGATRKAWHIFFQTFLIQKVSYRTHKLQQTLKLVWSTLNPCLSGPPTLRDTKSIQNCQNPGIPDLQNRSFLVTDYPLLKPKKMTHTDSVQ